MDSDFYTYLITGYGGSQASDKPCVDIEDPAVNMVCFAQPEQASAEKLSLTYGCNSKRKDLLLMLKVLIDGQA